MDEVRKDWCWRRLKAVGLLMLASASGVSCTSAPEDRRAERTLRVSDFASAQRPPQPQSTAATSAPVGGQVQGDALPPLEAGSSAPVTTTERTTDRRLRPGEPVIIDSVVGQVSGRPLFAHNLLEPIADRLQQESRRSNAAEFRNRAAQIVNAWLLEVVRNELFLAEAEAGLTQQQQQGLIALLRDVQERTVAEGAGSRALREQQLREERGLTLDEYLEVRRSEMLISNLIAEKIRPRVIVSWKDVQREYARRFGEFNPPARVTLKRIRLFGDQQEQIERVKQRLAAGEGFDVVAADAMPGEDPTWDTFQMGSGGVSDIPIAEAYKPHLATLTQGQTSPAIELEGRVVWLHVDGIQQPPGRSLYEVQRELQIQLFQRRFEEERGRYIRNVLEKGIYDELDQMSQRIMNVALMRYSPTS